MIKTPCIIFAGGKSSRMGEDKALLPFGDKPTLTEFQYKRLKQIFQDVYISCKDAKKFDFSADFIEDIQTENIYAPTAGFITVFSILHAKYPLGVEEIFVLSVDTPFISINEINEILRHKDDNYDAIIARTPEGIHPMCGVYKKALHVSFQNMLQTNEHKLTKLLKESNTLFVEFEDESNFLNLNNPGEYKEALSRLNQDPSINQ
jgi:molybdopterin-guanine dinucleotide biosynthesis protein A